MRTLSRPIHLSLPFLTWALIILVGPSSIHAQTNGGTVGGCTTNGACDPGPRNPGDTNAPFCPNTAPPDEKFPGSTCVDFAQPPAVQPPAAGAGNVVAAAPNTVNNLIPLWFEAIPIFEEVASVQGTAINNVTSQTEQIIGLGPAFNSNSCFSCHEAPAVGGTSGGSVSIQISPTSNTTFTFLMPLNFSENPELQAKTDDGNNTNTDPTFPTQFNSGGNPTFTTVLPQGPSLEVRIISSGNGGGSGGFVVQPGSVAELFTIQGRTDAPNCVLAQFPFSSLPARSISFRIPTPTFGLGFVEATPDLLLEGNLAATNATIVAGSGGLSVATIAANLGVGGTFNRSGNDGTITRFGWKAQNKSLLIFAGEASNVEMGVTNNLFPNEKTVAGNGPGTTPCPTNVAQSAGGFGDQPEDELLSINVAPPPSGATLDQIASIISTNAENNRVFMLLNGAPSQCDETTAGKYGSATPVCNSFTSPLVLNGQAIFNNLNPSSTTFVGCALCHTPTQSSGLSQQAALSNQIYHPFSDFALHTMGNNTTGLADGVMQGLAGSQQFRTAPLWGLGQRLFFLHDGRASNLADAILDHCPTALTTPGPSTTNESCGSITKFLGLSPANQQDLLDYLRSL
ncbi:MAG: di-heme oxidoredictase family protein [Candidatus Sulfotelmatobacter sp.]